MRRLAATAGLLTAASLQVSAQTPPGQPAPGQTAAPTTSEANKAGSDAVRAPASRSVGGRTSFDPAPMNIRIREEGVKLPKCAKESREGEECKK